MKKFHLTSAGKHKMMKNLFKYSFSAIFVLSFIPIIYIYFKVSSPIRWYVIGVSPVILIIYAIRLFTTRFDLWEIQFEDEQISIYAGETAKSIRCRRHMNKSEVKNIIESKKGLTLMGHKFPSVLEVPIDIENYNELRLELEKWTYIQVIND
jgi:uncharacterized protein YkvS